MHAPYYIACICITRAPLGIILANNFFIRSHEIHSLLYVTCLVSSSSVQWRIYAALGGELISRGSPIFLSMR